jgi:peptide/nickel transport system permease protein
VRRHPLLIFAAGLIAVLAAAALGADLIAPYDPVAQSVIARLRGPSAAHWLGTDQLGRDVLARILYGARASLLACGAAVALALVLGGGIGLAAAYRGGFLDRVLMRLMDIVFAFPILLLAIGIVAVLGPHPASAALAIGIVYVPVFARLLRGPALVVCASDYVQAARALGVSDTMIVLRHVLPNLASVILVQASLLLSAGILVEASLSFLGLGTQPPSPSLGLMLAEGRNFLLLAPWPAVFAGLAILILAFGFNLLGDALRDTLDPRLRD